MVRYRKPATVLLIAGLMLTLIGQLSVAAVAWPQGAKFGEPDSGNFGWVNIDASYLRWHGRNLWGTSKVGNLRQAYNQHWDPTLEFEGWNPGQKTDCDNLNYSSYNGNLPRAGAADVKDAEENGLTAFFWPEGCSGQNRNIREQVDVFLDGSTSGIQANILYDMYIVWSKTYLYDYNPSWREVNLTYEEACGTCEHSLGKLKYDIRGTADGYPNNGVYAYTCANPAGAVGGLPGCP
jgi:hypothetical protein